MPKAKPIKSPTAQGLDQAALAYTASIAFDRRLYRYDIAASIAHARMLARQGIIPGGDAEAIVRGLEEIRREIERGEFSFRQEMEDIHLNIEARLYEKIGEAAGRLHTARSRNDQVATDMRLFVKEACDQAVGRVRALQLALLGMAEANREVVAPGYTHLQRAQPLLLAHHLLAYFEMFDRDSQRFADCCRRADVLPLGAGALAGVPYPIDREFVARELGFSRIAENSVDAVADRDFVVEFQAAAAVAMMHLSRLAEEIVLWSSAEFGFIELPAEFSTGSSIMPQKRNPDVAELARGKTGRIYGNLMAILTTLKGLPLAYNRDLQEDKEPLLDTVDTLLSSLEVMAAMLPALRVDAERAEAAAAGSYALATDVADYLVRKGAPFREAHQAVAALVRYAESQGKALEQLTLEEYRRFSALFEEDVLRLDVRSAIAARDVPGGTAPRRVAAALKRARQRLAREAGLPSPVSETGADLDTTQILHDVEGLLREQRRSRRKAGPEIGGFSALYDAYFTKVFDYVYKRLGDEHQAADVTMEVFERAFARASSLPSEEAFGSWLLASARSVLDHPRLRSVPAQPIGDVRPAGLATSNLWPDQPGFTIITMAEKALLEQERTTRLNELIRGLSKREQEVLSLRFGGDLTNRQIAEAMGVKERTVRVFLHRALGRLRERMEERVRD